MKIIFRGVKDESETKLLQWQLMVRQARSFVIRWDRSIVETSFRYEPFLVRLMTPTRWYRRTLEIARAKGTYGRAIDNRGATLHEPAWLGEHQLVLGLCKLTCIRGRTWPGLTDRLLVFFFNSLLAAFLVRISASTLAETDCISTLRFTSSMTVSDNVSCLAEQKAATMILSHRFSLTLSHRRRRRHRE